MYTAKRLFQTLDRALLVSTGSNNKTFIAYKFQMLYACATINSSDRFFVCIYQIYKDSAVSSRPEKNLRC